MFQDELPPLDLLTPLRIAFFDEEREDLLVLQEGFNKAKFLLPISLRNELHVMKEL